MIQGNYQDIRRGCILFSHYDKDCKSSLLALPSSWSSLHAGAVMLIPFSGLAASHPIHELAAVLLHRLSTSCHKEELALIWSITALYSSKFSLRDIGIGNISCYLHWRYLLNSLIPGMSIHTRSSAATNCGVQLVSDLIIACSFLLLWPLHCIPFSFPAFFLSSSADVPSP